MSDRSDEPNQGWGIVLASDRSPPLSPGSASPPGHPSGQGSVLPHYSHDSVMSLKNILNSEIIQCSRPESSDSSSVPHATFLRTPFEQIAASQFSMMAADQFGGEDFKAIHDTTLEVHGKPPTQFLKGFGEMTYGNTTPPEGLRSVGSASAAGSVNASLHQNLLYGNREGHFSYGQTILTPVSMASSRDSGSAADSGDEEHDGVILANAVDMEIECGHDVQDSPAQRRGRRVPSGTAELLPKSYVTPPLQSAGSPLYSHFHDQYPSFSPSTANLHGLVQRDELGLVGGENDCGRPNDIMELSDLQSIRPGSKLQSIQSSGAAGLGITSSAHPSMNAQHDNTLSSLSALGPAYTPVIDHTDQPATHQAMNPPHVVNNYDNSFSDNSPSHGAGSVSFNSITQEIALETSGELVPTGGHAPTSPESAILTAEGFDATTADTAAVTAVDDSSLPPAQSDESIIPLFLQQAQHTTPISSQILTAGFTIQPSHDSTDMDPLDYMVDDFERNIDVSTLLEHWTISYGMKDSDFPPVGDQALKVREWKRPDEVLTKHLNGDLCDPQGINWAKLGTTRENARMVRNRLYVNYTNIKHASPSEYAQDITETENYFRFRRTDTRKMACLSHFQLRNLLCATSKNEMYYAGRSKILCADRSLGTEQCIMDFTNSDHHSDYTGPMKISTLAAGHGVLIAGGFGGEYAMKSLSSDFDSKHMEGLVTDHDNGITNHIHTIFDRVSGVPQAIFASNDCCIRTLDCSTNTFIKEHKHHWAVNCTATSPDGRLRVVVGDTRHAYICNADTGRPMVKLRNHRDFGFACAWADDGIHVATGNQDATVQIWDARMWSHPLQIIASEIAGVRSLRFSPVGGGKRVLLMAEPADIISVVDAESFESKQRFDVFGEIGGISFTPDGSEFFVANTDRKFGGIMEYERIGYGEQYGMRYLRQREIEDAGDDYYDEKGFEWVADEDLDGDNRVEITETHRSRRGLDLGSMIL